MTTALSEKELRRDAVARLEADVLAAQEEREDLRDERDSLGAALDRTTAEVERLRAELDDTLTLGHGLDSRLTATEERLAAANALVDAIRREAESVNGKYAHPDLLERAVCIAFDNIRAHLAAQPATAREEG